MTAVAGVAPRLRVEPGIDVGRPIRAAVLTNPRGGFNQRRSNLARVRAAVAPFDVPHIEASTPTEIHRAAVDATRDGTELLIVNGGDGTVQMVLTALFAANPPVPQPLLAVVPGGTSNTIPGDVGWQKQPPRAIAAALQAAARGRLDGHVVHRAVMQIETSLWEQPLCALQFSAGAVYNAIRFAKDRVESRGAHGATGPAVTLAWFVLSIVSGRAGEIFPPMRMTGTMDSTPVASGPQLGLVASTLDHLFLGIRPFWGDRRGPLRYSAIAYRPRRFLLALIPALRGRRGRWLTPENGYESRDGERLELTIDAGFTLDGELFEAGPETRVRITAPHTAAFLRAGAPA